MLHSCFIFQSNALEGAPKISQKINEAHKCWKFVLSLLDFFLKWSPKQSTNLNTYVCSISLFITSLIIFHCQFPVSIIAFQSFGVKISLGEDCAADDSCHSILSSPAASVLCPGGMWSHSPGIFTTASWPWTTPF